MKRVLIVSQHFPPEKSGNASRIHDMAVHLNSMGVQVTVISPHPTFPTGTFTRVWKLSQKKRVDGVESINLWTWQPTSRDPGFLSRISYYLLFPLHTALWTCLHSGSYDLIITSAPPLFTHIPGIISKKILGKPWIMEIRDLWIDASISLGFLKKGSVFEKMSRALEAYSLRSADLVTVTTEELGRRLTSDRDVQEKIRWLPNGVDTDYFQPSSAHKKQQMIYAGNIGHAQDLENVILSLKIITPKFPLKLCIVGDGDIKDNLIRLVQREGLSESVTFTGLVPRESVPQMLSESLIGLAPLKKLETLEYAAPTKAYEYMACGIPFLGCGKGEIENIARESGAGVIADNTPEAIAAAVLGLLQDPHKMDDMGKSGRAYVVKHYDRRAIAAKLKEYVDLISHGN